VTSRSNDRARRTRPEAKAPGRVVDRGSSFVVVVVDVDVNGDVDE